MNLEKVIEKLVPVDVEAELDLLCSCGTHPRFPDAKCLNCRALTLIRQQAVEIRTLRNVGVTQAEQIDAMRKLLEADTIVKRISKKRGLNSKRGWWWRWTSRIFGWRALIWLEFEVAARLRKLHGKSNR